MLAVVRRERLASGTQALRDDSPAAIAEMEISNPSEFAREASPIYVSYYDLGLLPDDSRIAQLTARIGRSVVPSQSIDEDGDGIKDGVLTLVNLKPAESLTLSIVVDPTASVRVSKAHAGGDLAQDRRRVEAARERPDEKEYVGGTFRTSSELTPPPEHTDHSNFIRYEGPGIESDKVAYRIYLDWRNGFDIFGKKTPDAGAAARVGLDGFESYHHMADWGMDILKVGSVARRRRLRLLRRKEGRARLEGRRLGREHHRERQPLFVVSHRLQGLAGRREEVDATADFSMLGGSRAVQARARA